MFAARFVDHYFHWAEAAVAVAVKAVAAAVEAVEAAAVEAVAVPTAGAAAVGILAPPDASSFPQLGHPCHSSCNYSTSSFDPYLSSFYWDPESQRA